MSIEWMPEESSQKPFDVKAFREYKRKIRKPKDLNEALISMEHEMALEKMVKNFNDAGFVVDARALSDCIAKNISQIL